MKKIKKQNKKALIDKESYVIDSFIEDNVTVIKSVIEGANIKSGSTIGPFAHIRPKSNIGANCRIGNFVEIKNSTVGDNTKISHLTYVGDADIGKNCNIGCGVVFCNYNGKEKNRTTVGDNVFIGSNANIIAPCVIGDGCYIACGTTVSGQVEAGSFMIGRAYPENSDKLAKKYIKGV